ncbi:MAG: hypothetical protein PHR30_04625 [Gallionellaceae bacterium]|nr:hypothetical protein [Gallionellaceae bacterium]
MKSTAKWLTVLALTMAASGQAVAETGKPAVEAQAIRLAAWERVGDAGSDMQSAVSSRIQAPGEDRLRARKADMVRRMFWIMMAHR